MVVLNFDLVSYCISIFLGLYSDDLKCLQLAEEEDFWNFIKKEFQEKEQLSVLKTCGKNLVNSSFFLEGNNGMIKSIIGSFKKDVGMLKKE